MNEATDELRLYIPRREDGWFYVKMLTDPATMAYNAPWFPPDGCIPDAAEEWEDLCSDWIGRVPERFYAYLQRVSDGAFVGDVNYHRNGQGMGIVICAPERGKGYGKAGLRLLLDRAFRVDGVIALRNDFETDRDARRERRWTRGLAIAALVISVMSLCIAGLSLYLQYRSLSPR